MYRPPIASFIGGLEIGFSIFVVRDRTQGITLVLCAGIRGDEYESIIAIRECFRELNPSNMMCHLGILKGNFQKTPPTYFRESQQVEGHVQIHHLSGCHALFLPRVSSWQRVEVGQEIGAIYNPVCDTLQIVRAEHSGRIVVSRSCPSVAPNDFPSTIIPLVFFPSAKCVTSAHHRRKNYIAKGPKLH